LTENSRNDRFDWDKEKKLLRVKLCNNQIIEQHLGTYDIICIEDLIHEIYSVGPFFDIVNELLAPFFLVPRPGRGLNAAKKKSCSTEPSLSHLRQGIKELTSLLSCFC